MNSKSSRLIVNYKLNAILILISWGVFLKLNPKIVIYLIPASIIQFLYSHRDYQIEISELKFSLCSLFKSKRVIEISSISKITIEKVMNRYSSTGAKQKMIIENSSDKFEFDIYKFDNKDLMSILENKLGNERIILLE